MTLYEVQKTAPSTYLPLRITVVVISYKRPHGLARLLSALSKQKQQADRPYCMTVLVVDNDALQSARPVVELAVKTMNLRCTYVVENKLGIPCARNMALKTIDEEEDLLAFIDDDEWPSETWLDEMLKVRSTTGAQCVWGPVEPSYPKDAPESFMRSGIFERMHLADCSPLPLAASNNVIFERQFISQHNIEFDEGMRFCGGSDVRFFKTAVKVGMRIYWSENGVVNEDIPKSRMTWKWIIRRQYRIGNSIATWDDLGGKKRQIIHPIMMGSMKIITGAALAPAAIFSSKWRMKVVTQVMRGAGMIGAIAGLTINEYAPVRLNRDRDEAGAVSIQGSSLRMEL